MDMFLTADLAIINWVIDNLRTPFLDGVMPFITTLGDKGFIWILLALGLLLFRKTRRWGILCALALFIGYLVGEVGLKNIICRPRPFTFLPDFQLLISPPSSFSFPSGHTASSFAGAVSFFFIDRRNGWWAFPLAGLIAFSRLYLSVHFLTDILAGAALGVAAAFLARWLLTNAQRLRT